MKQEQSEYFGAAQGQRDLPAADDRDRLTGPSSFSRSDGRLRRTGVPGMRSR